MAPDTNTPTAYTPLALRPKDAVLASEPAARMIHQSPSVGSPAGEHLTLTQAAKIAPGRPSTNCIWRWCRRGVLARTGERVHLEHIRVGGKIFTTARWVSEFGRHLADADRTYFDRNDAEEPNEAAPTRHRCSSRQSRHAVESQEEVERELEEAGL